jgi:hypothetical protein
MLRLRLVMIFSMLAASALGCSTRTTNLASSAPGAGDAAADAPSDAGRDAQPPLHLDDAGVVLCGPRPCACSNGADDDGDGLNDGLDPECTGPFDNDEASFATGRPGEAEGARCLDCFFDENPGHGDDDCRYPASCGEDGTAHGGGRNCDSCEPSTMCIDSCLARTPNGCDCFGCCEVDTPDGPLVLRLLHTCSMKPEDLADETKCPRCQQSDSCVNPCGPCELCHGKTLADLPPGCAAVGGPGYVCETGRVCGAALPCPELEYCELGCCIPIVF